MVPRDHCAIPTASHLKLGCMRQTVLATTGALTYYGHKQTVPLANPFEPVPKNEYTNFYKFLQIRENPNSYIYLRIH